MVRIIPWKLPDVAGGSVGGYTPRGGGGGGDDDPPEVHYDFSSAQLGVSYWTISPLISVGVGETKDINKGKTTNGTSVSGISIIDAVGVASIKMKIESTTEQSNGVTYESVSFADIDPVTLIATLSSVSSATAENNGASSFSVSAIQIYRTLESFTQQSLVLTFYVYDGNGEIIQQEEVTLV